MSNERDELAQLINRTINQEYSPGDDVMGADLAPAIFAAGYRRPRTITTVEELDALPVGSVVLRNGRAFTRFAPRSGPFGEYHMWQCPDGGFVRSTKDGSSFLPVTVLHEPEPQP